MPDKRANRPLRRTAACGHGCDGLQRHRDHPWWPCGRGNRAGACGRAWTVDRYASFFSIPRSAALLQSVTMQQERFGHFGAQQKVRRTAGPSVCGLIGRQVRSSQSADRFAAIPCFPALADCHNAVMSATSPCQQHGCDGSHSRLRQPPRHDGGMVHARDDGETGGTTRGPPLALRPVRPHPRRSRHRICHGLALLPHSVPPCREPRDATGPGVRPSAARTARLHGRLCRDGRLLLPGRLDPYRIFRLPLRLAARWVCRAGRRHDRRDASCSSRPVRPSAMHCARGPAALRRG